MYPNLKLQMWLSGVRQNQLARVLGMDKTGISRIVNGYRKPNETTRAQIAGFLNCDEAWLFSPKSPGKPVPSPAGEYEKPCVESQGI